MLFCLDDLDKKHRDVINSYKFLLFVFRHNLGFEPATIALHASPDTLRIHTNSSKLLHVILYLKALFGYALWPAVFDCTVRYGIGTGQVRDRYGRG